MAERGRPKRMHCRKCDRHVDECGELSARGLCDYCGIGAIERNAYGLANHDAEYLRRWRRGVARSIGAVLPEDVSHDKN